MSDAQPGDRVKFSGELVATQAVIEAATAAGITMDVVERAWDPSQPPGTVRVDSRGNYYVKSQHDEYPWTCVTACLGGRFGDRSLVIRGTTYVGHVSALVQPLFGVAVDYTGDLWFELEPGLYWDSAHHRSTLDRPGARLAAERRRSNGRAGRSLSDGNITIITNA